MANGGWPTGTPVRIRNRFDGAWAPGFEITRAYGINPITYEVRRRSDNAVLPTRFEDEELLPDGSRQGDAQEST